jgi:pSer/pThr/pTyr-binding forkhead associated (FHA) protein
LRLHLLPADGPPRLFDIARGAVVVGRDSGGLEVRDRKLSKRHARFIRLDDALWVEDLGSKNGTFIGGTRVSGRVRLRHGDVVQMGDLIAYVDEQTAPGAPDPMGTEVSSPSAIVEDTDVLLPVNRAAPPPTSRATGGIGPGVRIILAADRAMPQSLTAMTPLRMLLSRDDDASVALRVTRYGRGVQISRDGAPPEEIGGLDVVSLPGLRMRFVAIDDALPYASSIAVVGGFLAFLPDDAPLLE